MTANPDVLGPDEEAGGGLGQPVAPRLPPPPGGRGGELVGVVSLRDLLAVAQLRPGDEPGADVPRGLEGVVVAETAIGDVRGLEGFYHYRQYSAVELAATRTLEDVWYLLFDGRAPRRRQRPRLRRPGAALRAPAPRPGRRCCPCWPGSAPPSTCCAPRCRCSAPSWGGAPTHDIDRGRPARPGAAALCAVVPTMLDRGPPAPARAPRRSHPRDDLAHAGQLPVDAHRRGARRRRTPGRSSSTSCSPSTTGSTPRPSPPG